jgi:vitamin B12 transporter
MALTDAVTLSGQVSLFDSTNDTGEDEIRVPKQTASLAVLWATEDAGWHAGAAVDFVGEQDDFDFGSYPSRRVTLDSYFLVSANAAYPVTERISLTLRGENLLDEDISDVYGYVTPGAAVYLGLKLR